MDTRLTKVAPAKTKTLAISKDNKTVDANNIDEQTLKITIRQNNILAGKAIPFTMAPVKSHSGVSVKVSIYY